MEQEAMSLVKHTSSILMLRANKNKKRPSVWPLS